MKKLRWVAFATLIVGVVFVYSAPQAKAVHDADLTCSSCHTMHGTDGAGSDASTGYYLLKSGNQSNAIVGSNDACLACHDGTQGGAGRNVNGATNDTPGGDFDNLAAASPGYNKGHDIWATGLVSGGTAGTASAPTADGGATNDFTDFRCAKCHDPHLDDASVYRLLRSDPDGSGAGGAVPTVAKHDLGTWTGETSTSHNGYQSGFSAWCADCHTNIDDESFHHPAGGAAATLPAGYVTNYGATWSESAPFEDADLAADASTGPDSTNSKVFCLSCHKSHASANDFMGRFDLTGAQGAGAGCNKCHGK